MEKWHEGVEPTFCRFCSRLSTQPHQSVLKLQGLVATSWGGGEQRRGRAGGAKQVTQARNGPEVLYPEIPGVIRTWSPPWSEWGAAT